MEAEIRSKDIQLTFSQDEGIILLDWLIEFNGKTKKEHVDQIVDKILCDLESVLESNVIGLLRKDYDKQLSRAREKLLG